MSAFDDKRAAAWSDSNGAVGMGATDFGVQVSGVTTDSLGATIAILGDTPLGLGVVTYNVNGALEQFGVDLAPEFNNAAGRSPSLLGAPEAIAGVSALVAIGGLGAEDTILLYDVGGGTPFLVGSVSGEDCGASGQNLGERMAFRATGEEGSLDLLAIRGNELFIFPAINPSGSQHECHRCELPGIASDIAVGDLLVADDEASNEDPEVGEEVFVSFEGLFTAMFAQGIAQADEAQVPCFQGASSLFPPRGAGDGPSESDFGTRIAVGDVDDNGVVDLAFTAPSTNSVYVLSNFDQSNPVEDASALIAPPDSRGFGRGPIAFLDLDTTEGDELAVGDPLANPKGKTGAGQVTLFEFSDDGVFERRAILHDSEPQKDQSYGRALAAIEYVFGEDDTDLLVVGASGEAFTLFRSLSNGLDPR